jgi:hypothetical protein
MRTTKQHYESIFTTHSIAGLEDVVKKLVSAYGKRHIHKLHGEHDTTGNVLRLYDADGFTAQIDMLERSIFSLSLLTDESKNQKGTQLKKFKKSEGVTEPYIWERGYLGDGYKLIKCNGYFYYNDMRVYCRVNRYGTIYYFKNGGKIFAIGDANYTNAESKLLETFEKVEAEKGKEYVQDKIRELFLSDPLYRLPTLQDIIDQE